MVVWSMVEIPDTKKMVETSWLLAALLSLMHNGSERIKGMAKIPPKASM